MYAHTYLLNCFFGVHCCMKLQTSKECRSADSYTKLSSRRLSVNFFDILTSWKRSGWSLASGNEITSSRSFVALTHGQTVPLYCFCFIFHKMRLLNTLEGNNTWINKNKAIDIVHSTFGKGSQKKFIKVW